MISENDCYEIIFKFLRTINKDGGFEMSRIKELLGKSKTTEKPNVGPIYTFESMFGSLWISKRTGNIVMYCSPDSDCGNNAIKIEEPRAKKIAIDFIKMMMPAFSENKFELAEVDTIGDCFCFEFEEIREKEEISIFENFVLITVKGDSGDIKNFSRSDLTFIRTTLPPISEAQAKNIIENYIKPYKGKLLKIKLIETPTKSYTSSQPLWSAIVSYRGGKGEYRDIIEIDASTGRILKDNDQDDDNE
jgi:hypothetical protein